MSSIPVSITQGGRIVIPAEIRHKMGLKVGDQVLLSWSEETHELRVATRKQRLQHARDLVKLHANTETGSVVDELINERKQAAADE